MSADTARGYFERSDDPEATPTDTAALLAADSELYSPRERILRGHDEVQHFYELNTEFFAEGEHTMHSYQKDGEVVVSEGTTNARTTGRSYDGVGFVDVMKFYEDDEISALRVYLDDRAILSELPDECRTFGSNCHLGLMFGIDSSAGYSSKTARTRPRR